MPKYLRTSGISAGVEDLIRESRERLFIISPYLKLSDHIKELLSDKERDKTDVRIIFGKQELNPVEMSFLQSLKYVRLYFSKNLHAKCYLNERRMIITSMNLYEFSQQNNREMGILIERDSEVDRQTYEDAWKDIESILHNATDFSYKEAPKEPVKNVAKADKGVSLPNPEGKKNGGVQTGYCIRTGVKIPFDVKKPMSYEAFKAWSVYNNEEYAEKFCHFSGEPSDGQTSMKFPILKKNWNKAKEVFGM